MKTIKILFSVILLATVSLSCSGDDPLATVKYQITGLDASVAEIKYKNAFDGTTDILTNGDINKFNGGKDSKSIAVNFTPFDADLVVIVNNTSGSVKHYTLVIYQDGVAKASTNYDAPANSISTGEVDYTVQ
jgi:hypothetical protein